MEELFDSIYILIPVALLLFIRVFSEAARIRADKARKTGAGKSLAAGKEANPPTPRKPRRTTPHTQKLSLFSRFRDYLAGRTEQDGKRLEPLHFEEEAAGRLARSIVPPGSAGASVAPANSRPMALLEYGQLLPGAMEESPAIARHPARPYSFPERLNNLSPLRKAVVMAEVLGKPKSLQ